MTNRNEPGIILHPKKGINPHLGMCPRCGKDSGEILLFGKANKIYKYDDCNVMHIGYPTRGVCPKCKSKVIYQRELEDHERVAAGLCDECRKEVEEHKRIVEDGGVYFRCLACRKEGVIRKCGVIEDMRVQLKLGPTDPCGVEFTHEDPCPNCKPKEVTND